MRTKNNTSQVNGSHYESIGSIEPVHMMKVFHMNWFQGEVLKYVSRHWDKNKEVDLDKAIHIMDMAIDLEVESPLVDNWSLLSPELYKLRQDYIIQFRDKFTNDFYIFGRLIDCILDADWEDAKHYTKQLKSIFYGDR